MHFPEVAGPAHARTCARFTLRPLAAALALACTPAIAQQVQPEVVVTATRTPIAVDAALASVSVIDRADIEAAGSTDIVTLLRQQSGIDIARTGGLGQQASVFMRGGNSNHTLVLIDGVRVASTNTGAYAWEHLPLAQIERIEIVRGPRAALYGSDAIGGVIQIFTRRADGIDGTIGVGNQDTGHADVGFAQAGNAGRFGVRGGYTETAGFNSQNPQGFAFDPDRDGFVQRSLSADAAWDFGGVRLDGIVLHNDNDVEFDQGVSSSRNTALRVSLDGGAGSTWKLTAAGARETLETPAFFSRFETRRRQLDWQHALPLADAGELLWGLSAVRDEGRNIETFGGSDVFNEQRDHSAGFAAWRDGAGAFDWELAGRYDDYDGFGGESTAQAALGWKLDDAWRLRANAGEGFRAPNLNELYSPGFGGLFAGNPALEPEQSRTRELALEYGAGGVTGSLRAYHTRVRDLIDFAGDDFQAVNIGRARLQGVELDWQWQGDQWQARGNLGYLDAENRDAGIDLLRRAPRKANVAVEHALGRGWVGVDLHAESERPDFGAALAGYGALGVTARWPLADTLDLDIRVDNLLDRDYIPVYGYNAPGMIALVQLRWRGFAR